MYEFWGCVVAEIQALGAWCLVHGPESWLLMVAVCIFSVGVLCGMFIAALLSANNK